MFQGGVTTPCVTMAANAREVTTRPVSVPADTRAHNASTVSRSALLLSALSALIFLRILTMAFVLFCSVLLSGS